MTKRKICVVTGTRAEYGLFYWTLRKLQEEPGIQLQIVVTGMHLSPEFGLTYQQIEKDGFNIDRKLEMLLSSDTAPGITKSMGVGLLGFADAFAELQPDLILVLGDRYEILMAASAAMIARIPIAHCHGGEATEGVIDESIRHSITKMSQIHLVSTEVFRKRVIQLGESPHTVFNVGALGIENINRLELLSREAFEESIQFKLGARNILVTFHPITLEKSSAESQTIELLKALDEQENTSILFTKANADTDGRIINQLIDQYVQEHSNKAIAHTSLGQLRYLSAIRHVDAVVGNSSSGLLEVPSFKKPTVNIGDRQKGRIMPDSIINCNPDYLSIKNAIQKALSPDFREISGSVRNPYGEGNASGQIVEILKNIRLDNILKKKFYDINFELPN